MQQHYQNREDGAMAFAADLAFVMTNIFTFLVLLLMRVEYPMSNIILTRLVFAITAFCCPIILLYGSLLCMLDYLVNAVKKYFTGETGLSILTRNILLLFGHKVEEAGNITNATVANASPGIEL